MGLKTIGIFANPEHMTIAVNCWVLRNKKLDGIGYYTVNVVTNLLRDHPEAKFLLLCDKNFSEPWFDFPNATIHRIFPAFRHPVLYVYYMELVVPRFLRKHKPDLLVSTDGMLSLATNTPQLPLIHDINFEHNPKDLDLKNRIYYRRYFPRFAKKATRIATISEYSKRDIVNEYGIDPGKIDNISGGINSSFSPADELTVTRTRNKWSEGKPYFLFIGSMHPRKNIGRLLQAFELFKKDTGSDCKLLLAGSITWKQTEIERIYGQHEYKNDIVFTGRLSDEDLGMVLGSALALSFVPVFEGFGLPIVEAMQASVPVICSNVTSMPEVAGDAALLVDPYDINSIADGMKKLYMDEELRRSLIAKGNLQKEKFSWKRSATLLWGSIQKLKLAE
jgi:glycosyltransferase involved in cell wall biosynthesis